MNYILIFIVLLISSLNTIFAQKELIPIDKIAAQVGDYIILNSEIEKQIIQLKNNGEEITDDLSCEIFESIMFQKLLLHQAKLDSIEIPDAQVESELEGRLRTIEQQIGSRQKLEEFYGKSTFEIKNEFREVIKDRLLAQEVEASITRNVSVTPKEVKAFFSTIPTDSIPLINMQLSFQQIVNYPEITKEDKDLAYKKLHEIAENIKNGKSFETQARIHSMDPGSASLGGKISATRGMMVPQFESTLFNLKEGQISDIFETDYGYHIVQLIDRKGDDYECRHILIIPEVNHNSLIYSSNLIDSCFTQLSEGKITWEEAVLKYSNDEMTKQNKGIITNPITGEQTWDMEHLNQVDQQIFILTDAMEKGEVSTPNLYTDIYERKQGIRIVRLMDRTDPHLANLKDDYSLIKLAAENDKKQKTINNWVQNKISKSYIKIDSTYKDCIFKNNWLAN
jgi:peptidyl-prolyl cis-trans isomerase SurA